MPPIGSTSPRASRGKTAEPDDHTREPSVAAHGPVATRRPRNAARALAVLGAVPVCLGLGAVTAGPAAAAVEYAPPAASAGATGGATSAPPPEILQVECRKACSGKRPRAGSTLALKGRALRYAESVTFLGSRFPGDEVTVRPRRSSERRVLVRVPAQAVRGRVSVTTAEGGVSKKTSPVVRIVQVAMPKSTGGPIATALTAKKVYFDGKRRPALTYSLRTDRPASVRVEVVNRADGTVVASFDEGVVQPGELRTVRWDARIDGQEPPEGHYGFVVHALDANAAVIAASAQATPPPADSFLLLSHRFPVRGKHHYGSTGASFGGGRGHQGQDVFAKCGTPLLAARGGVVKMRRFQSRAGHYVVIDGEQTDVDMAYMHLQKRALVKEGERVRTGQLIGYVGDTGRASGCHLHFEMWSGPGWYTGGSPFDPLPHLKAWDDVT